MQKFNEKLNKDLMAAFAAGAKNKQASAGTMAVDVATGLVPMGAKTMKGAKKAAKGLFKQTKIKAKEIKKYGTVDEKRIATKTGDKMTKFFDKNFGSGGKKRAKAVKAVREAGDDQAKLIEANKKLTKLDRNRTWKRVGAGVGAAGLLGGAGVGGGLVGNAIGNG